MIAIDIIKKRIGENPNFCYLTKIANEHLSEYVDKIDNIVEPLTGFTGDTAYLYIDRFGFALLVDGRFTIQVKKETKNIDVVLINEMTELYDFINNRLNKLYDEQEHISIDYIKKDYDYYYKITHNDIKLSLDDRLFSISFVQKLINSLDYRFNGIIYDNKIANEIIEYNKQRFKEHYEEQANRKLFVLDNDKSNISKFIEDSITTFNYELIDSKKMYITSNLEEIASITNLRLRPISINDSLLFKSYLIIFDGKIYLYTDYQLEKQNTNKDLIINSYGKFYEDLKRIDEAFNIKCRFKDIDQKKIKQNEVSITIDTKKNNLKIINTLKEVDDLFVDIYINGNDLLDDELMADELYDSNIYTNWISEQLSNRLTKKTAKEIGLYKKVNVIDAIAMIKFIYTLKHFDFDKYDLTEYSLKKILDIIRSKQKGFLSTSFDTIVAFKENSAICHYSPKENDSKMIRNDSILLVDSGGNYIGGTTDITRVISLYKDKNRIPKDIKHYYTLVLKSLLSLSNQKFPDGYRGAQLDIIARQYLFNECIDYGHGTGHGIGNNTSVHYGTNIFSSRVKDTDSNVLKENQVQSCEPGVYFENKYGIRLENDTYTKKIKGTDYLTFETLTLCPFDKDLINMDELDRIDIERLHNYNKMVYNKMKKYFKGDILLWLKECTMY